MLVEGVIVDSPAGDDTKELRAYQDQEVWQGAPQMVEFQVKSVESMASVLFRVHRILEQYAKSMKSQLDHGAFINQRIVHTETDSEVLGNGP